MGPGLRTAPELLQALAEREMGVMGGGIDLEQPLECLARAVVLAGVVVGPPERLEDRRLARLRLGRPARGPSPPGRSGAASAARARAGAARRRTRGRQRDGRGVAGVAGVVRPWVVLRPGLLALHGPMVARTDELLPRARRLTPNRTSGRLSRVRPRMSSRSAGRSRLPGLAGGPAGTGTGPPSRAREPTPRRTGRPARPRA